jgi:hypothetical protein
VIVRGRVAAGLTLVFTLAIMLLVALLTAVAGSSRQNLALPLAHLIGLNAEMLAPPVVAPVPTSDSPTAFIVQADEIRYGRADTLNCQFMLGGLILLADEVGPSDIRVRIRMTDPLSGRGADGEIRRADARTLTWRSVTVNWTVTYDVYLADARDGSAISPHVLMPVRNCDRNLVLANFVQVAPLPR